MVKQERIVDIAKSDELWWNYDHFLSTDKGRCRVVAIHGLDSSTEEQYRGHENSTLVSLKPLSGEGQFQVMLDNATICDLFPS